MDLFDDPRIREVVGRKSAQWAWTEAVLNDVGKRIDIDPCAMAIMFPSAKAAKKFARTKLQPMIRAMPRLSAKVDLSGSRKSGNTWDHYEFPGGFLDLISSRVITDVKTVPYKRVYVEEPADAEENVGKQGNSIGLLRERLKTFADGKLIIGGTPAVKGLCPVSAEHDKTDQREFEVPCHHCGEAHVLSFEHLRCDEDPSRFHPVYGHRLPETAYYACPHCGGVWTDHDKNANVRRAEDAGFGWTRGTANAEVVGVSGNELINPFPGSRFARLMEKWLAAEHKAGQGQPEDLIVFVNSNMGQPYEYRSRAPGEELLRQRAESYAENTVPAPGLVLVAGVDVQHDRFAVILRAYGRGEESWLVSWEELAGNPLDKNDPSWEALEAKVFGAYRHESGAAIHARAASIDSSDGAMTDLVYDWVRRMRKKYPGCNTMAIKGQSGTGAPREIFAVSTKRLDHAKPTKAAKHGIKLFIVGTERAKDTLIGDDGWLTLCDSPERTGRGAGRFHVFDGVRADYYKQLLSEVKAPHRSIRNRKVWQLKAGQRNEALDAEVYALHAARSLRTNAMLPDRWDQLERQLVQGDLFQVDQAEPKPAAVVADKQQSLADLARQMNT